MITYNSKEWVSFIFFFHKSDTIRKLLPLIIAISFFTWGIAYVELDYLQLPETSAISNLNLMHTLLTFVISMLLVFRTNTAYERWWEGRKLWGSLVNNSRNLAIKLNAMLAAGDQVNRSFYRKSIPLYASVLGQHLHSEVTRLALDEAEHPELAAINRNRHAPNQVASLIFNRTHSLYRDGQIKGDQLIILNTELQSFAEICGACERIKNTPIPISYSAFIKKFIFIFVVTLPFSLVFSLGYYAIPVVAFIFYVLTSIELIAEEIEDPFGSDANDLPTPKMAANIKKHIAEILQ
ncbi:MAG TPA: bestrophin family protein [Panacibacter sp.]|nr:bestrophin family protein [Panacibacter sp.]